GGGGGVGGGGRGGGGGVGAGGAPPAGRAGLTPAGAIGPGLGRGPLLMSLAERAGIGRRFLARRVRGRLRLDAEVEGPVCPRRRQDRAQAGELVQPDLGRGPLLSHPAPWSSGCARSPPPRTARPPAGSRARRRTPPRSPGHSGP